MKQERQGCMDLWLAYADQLLRRRSFYFRVSTQEEPLCGAVFTLFDQTRMLFRSASNRAGAVWMPPLGYGAYRLGIMLQSRRFQSLWTLREKCRLTGC